MTSERFRLLVLDVDGVLTDGRFIWDQRDNEFKSFSFRDVNGVSIALRKGIEVAIISGEDSPITSRFAERFGISHVVQGCKDKTRAVRELSAKLEIHLSQVIFMGDDYQDRGAMEICGLSACPQDAHSSVREIAGFVANADGGAGAVRELVDFLFQHES